MSVEIACLCEEPVRKAEQTTETEKNLWGEG